MEAMETLMSDRIDLYFSDKKKLRKADKVITGQKYLTKKKDKKKKSLSSMNKSIKNTKNKENNNIKKI